MTTFVVDSCIVKPVPQISDAEWQVMETIWQRHPVAACDIIADLGKKSHWKSNTIRTLLARLVKKGALVYSKDGNRYFYEPRFTREQHVTNASDSFLGRIFGGATRNLLVHFAENGKLTKQDLSEFKKILEKTKE